MLCIEFVELMSQSTVRESSQVSSLLQRFTDLSPGTLQESQKPTGKLKYDTIYKGILAQQCTNSPSSSTLAEWRILRIHTLLSSPLLLSRFSQRGLPGLRATWEIKGITVECNPPPRAHPHFIRQNYANNANRNTPNNFNKVSISPQRILALRAVWWQIIFDISSISPAVSLPELLCSVLYSSLYLPYTCLLSEKHSGFVVQEESGASKSPNL